MELKETSWAYGSEYQQKQVAKYLNRANNHWRHRIELMQRLVRDHVRLDRAPAETTVVDVGCSIGTFAIEFARMGYRAIGVDFDPSAIEVARRLSEREGVAPQFECGDITDCRLPAVDIAVCFDIFEHLHDDELGALLVSLRGRLARGGSVVFHTYPSEADHIFYYGVHRVLPLLLFAPLPQEAFRRLARAYMGLVDVLAMLFGGKTYRESHKSWFHCNLLSRERLEDILIRAGYKIVFMDTDVLYSRRPWVARWFRRHPIAHPNIFGVAAVIDHGLSE